MNLFEELFKRWAAAKRAVAAAMFALIAALPGIALAQEVLYLTPDKATPDNFNILTFTAGGLTNRFGEPGKGWVDGRGWLSQEAPLNPTIFDGKKLVVVTTVFEPLNVNQIEVLKTAMTTRPETAFVIFSDGCCAVSGNLTPIVKILNDATQWGISLPATQVDGKVAAPLNTASPYQASFSSLNPLQGAAYLTISNVPTPNALYLPQGTAVPVAAARTSAYGFFVPKSAMNGGSCTFLTADASPFGTDSNTTQARSNEIISAFAKAALDEDGACNQAVPDVDLAVSFTGPAALAATPQTYTLQVKNLGNTASTAQAMATVTLPVGYTAQPLPNGCTSLAAPQNGFACTVPALAALTGEISYSVALVRATGAAPATSTAFVNPVVNGETVTANNTSTLLFTTAADVRIDLAGLPASGKQGDAYSGSFQCTNSGTAAMANAVCTVTGLPAGVQIAACSSNGAAWTSPATIPEGQTVVCQVSGTATQESVFPVQGTGGSSTVATDVTIAAPTPDPVPTPVPEPTPQPVPEPEPVPEPGAAIPVPSLSQWGQWLLSGLLVALGLVVVRRKHGQH